MALLLSLLEMRLLSPFLDVDDLGRLGLVHVELWNYVHAPHSCFWKEEILCRKRGNTSHPIPLFHPLKVKGENVHHSYWGGNNTWEFFRGENFFMDRSRMNFCGASYKKQKTIWQRFLTYLSYWTMERKEVVVPTSCFYERDSTILWLMDCYYVEITLDHLPPVDPDDLFPPALSFGLCTDPDYLWETDTMVGWTMQSIGFHTDDRVVRWNDQPLRAMHGRALLPGDVLGCGCRRTYDEDEWEVFFTWNGCLIFRKPKFLESHKPVTAVVMYDAEVDFRYRTNFGRHAFRYSLTK